MGGKELSRRVYYVDVIGGAVLFLIGARVVFVAASHGSRWDWKSALAVSIFLIALVGLSVYRSRAYTQTTPWLVASFSASAVVAIVVLFWPWHIVWFAAAIVSGCSLLAVALVMRTKTISESVSRYEIFKLVSLGFGACMALALVEVGLRLVPGIFGQEISQVLVADPSQYGVAHPYIGYLHRPNTTTIVSGRDFTAVHRVDAMGFRNGWPWPEHPEIVVVGDSVAFGYGVAAEEAWPAIVARALPREPLVNLALIGGGPQQYLRVYETFAVKLRPKLLMVGVFVRNDFWDAETFDRWLTKGVGANYMVWRDFGQPGPLNVSVGHPVTTLEGLFNRYVYRLLRMSRVYNLLRALRGGTEGNLATPPKTFRFADGRRLQLMTDDFQSKSAMSTKNTRAFQLAFDAFQRIHSLAAQNGAHALMVLQPSKEEVYLPLLEQDVPDPASSLRGAFDERGIDYLDLGPAFRERAAAGEQLFFEVDGHPNTTGYALMAQLVLSHVQQNRRKYGLEQTTDVPLSTPVGRSTPFARVSGR